MKKGDTGGETGGKDERVRGGSGTTRPRPVPRTTHNVASQLDEPLPLWLRASAFFFLSLATWIDSRV